MKMTPAKNICSLCNRTEVKFYDLKDSISPPNHLHFEGHTNLRAVLEKILNKEEEDKKTTNEICQKCREKLHGIYSFTQQHIESDKIFHRVTDDNVPLMKLKSFSILTDFKTEFEAVAETDKEDIDSLECSSTVCDSSAASGVVVKMECHSNFEDRIDFNNGNITRDLNIGLLEGKYSNAADKGSAEQMTIISIDSDNAEQITIQDEIIKEEWTMQEGDIFKANANHNGLDTEKTTLSYEMCDKPAVVEFQCDQCDVKCKTSRGLRDHKMFHSDEIFVCNQCDTRFSKKKNLTKHLQRVHTGAVFSCDHCDATYKRKDSLDLHKKIINGILFNCNQCHAKFKTQDSLIQHEMTHTGVIFACDHCDASFPTKRRLTQHMRGVHTDVVFFCDHCNATYKSKGGLKVHKQIINGILFNCDQCDAKYKTRDGLIHHKMTHTGVTFACNKCDAVFTNQRSLTRHLQEVHTDSVFSCDHCDATYKTKRALNQHKQIIKGILFNCDQCEKKYKRKQDLNWHKLGQHASSGNFNQT